MDELDFWKGKRVFVTGHTGFKGTWLAFLLKKLGATLCGYSLPADAKSLYLAARPRMDCEYIADIRDGRSLENALQEFQPEIVLHLASIAFIQPAVKDPHKAYSTNVMGLVQLMEGIRRTASVRSIVIVTSDKCYRNKESDVPYSEDSEVGAQDPYSTSKACQELVTESYRKSYFAQEGAPLVATARASNVLGGGDFHLEHLAAYLVECFMTRKVPQIRNPRIIRPWQNVLDVLWGYLLLAGGLYEGRKECARPFNFGPDEGGFVSVECLAMMLSGYFPGSRYEIVDKKEFLETKTLKISSRRAGEILAWHPRYRLEDSLQMEVEFCRRKRSGEDAGLICEDFVGRYVGRNI